MNIWMMAKSMTEVTDFDCCMLCPCIFRTAVTSNSWAAPSVCYLQTCFLHLFLLTNRKFCSVHWALLLKHFYLLTDGEIFQQQIGVQLSVGYYRWAAEPVQGWMKEQHEARNHKREKRQEPKKAYDIFSFSNVKPLFQFKLRF